MTSEVRSGTYFSCGTTRSLRSTRSHYTVLSATRHHQMVEAATFLAANVSLVIGSRNGKTVDSTRQRYWGSSSSAARHFVFGNVGASYLRSFPARTARISRAATFILPPFDLFVYEPFDPPFIRSFTCRPIRSSVRSSVHSSRRPTNFLVYPFIAMCIVLLLCLDLFRSRRVFTKLFLLLTLCWCSLRRTNPNSHGFLENAPLRYYIFTHE